MDPDGNNVIFLIAPTSANNNGHMGMLIQDKSGNWNYFFYGTCTQSTNMSLAQTLFGAMPADATLMYTYTKSKNGALLYARSLDSRFSEDYVEFETTSEMDDAIYNSALKFIEDYNSTEDYYVLFDNCSDGSEEIFERGSGVKLPFGLDPRPNKRFSNLKKNKSKIQSRLDKNEANKNSGKSNKNNELESNQFNTSTSQRNKSGNQQCTYEQAWQDMRDWGNSKDDENND